jgi:hypothetical protein
MFIDPLKAAGFKKKNKKPETRNQKWQSKKIYRQ